MNTADHTNVTVLKHRLQQIGSPDADLDALTLHRVIKHVYTADIGHTANIENATEALWQYPRPLWLVGIAGPHWINPSVHELDDPRDIATVDEFGHGDYGQAAA